MQKKHKRIFSILIVLISIFTIGHISLVVKGKDNQLEEDPMENISRTQCNIVTADDRYKATVTIPDDVNANYFTVSVKTGVFDVYVYEILNDSDGNTWPELRNSLVLGSEGNNKSAQVNYTKGNVPKHYEIVFSLKEADELCGVTEGSTVVRNNSAGSWALNSGMGYVYYHQVDIAANTANTKIPNINYNGICAALRTGNYDSYSSEFQKAGLSKSDFQTYYAEASNRLTYCNSEYVDANNKESEVAMMIRNAIASIKISQLGSTGTLSGPPNTSDTIIIGSDESTDLSDTPLQCPAYQNVNGIQKPNQSDTVQTYYKTVTTTTPYDVYTTIPGNDATCEKTCEEKVTVTYGPPVASKAGLCFEYKVKVESELNCVTEYKGDEPTPEDYDVCTPVGGCNGGALRSAGGPNDDFDSCVNSCDGGKYTQSCINSCYKEVYGESPTLGLNYTDKAIATQTAIYNRKKATQLATEEEMERYYDILNSKNDIGPGKKYSYEDLRVALTEAGTGYYYVNNGTIEWEAGERYWDRPGRYYTMNITEYTVGRLKSAGRWNSTWKQDGLSIIDSGFLRNNYGSAVCMASCSWAGCDLARTNGYYKGYPDNPGTATNRQFLNYEDANEVYKEEFERYENAVKECKASASCTTQTSEFTIKVNNKTNAEPEVDNWIDYQTSITESGTLNATTMNGKALSNTTIILDRSGCYTPETNTGNAKYMTEWSFPGTWVNNKTGKISYQPISGNAWHVKKEKFCTNLDSKYVNTDWWYQRVMQPNENITDDAKATIEEYNIIATAKDFGYFKWDFEIDCFYALYDAEADPTESTPDEDLEPLTYQARTVDLTDLFPDNKNETTTTNPNETGRTQGYNWTDGASNVKNADYEITPGALYPIIQARGNEIYAEENESSYLDYEFYLSPTDLNTIRKYNDSDADGNFSTYPGTIKVNNGIAYYESALFRNSSTSSYKLGTGSIITLGALGVNNQKSQGSNEAEAFTNSFVAGLLQTRDEYLKAISGGNTNE